MLRKSVCLGKYCRMSPLVSHSALSPKNGKGGKIVSDFQCFGYFGVLVEFFAVVHGDGVHPAFMCL